MVQVDKYYVPPTALMPNSPQPLLHYPGFFTLQEKGNAKKVHETFMSNGWETQWIFRYGQMQRFHYHLAYMSAWPSCRAPPPFASVSQTRRRIWTRTLLALRGKRGD